MPSPVPSAFLHGEALPRQTRGIAVLQFHGSGGLSTFTQTGVQAAKEQASKPLENLKLPPRLGEQIMDVSLLLWCGRDSVIGNRCDNSNHEVRNHVGNPL